MSKHSEPTEALVARLTVLYASLASSSKSYDADAVAEALEAFATRTDSQPTDAVEASVAKAFLAKHTSSTASDGHITGCRSPTIEEWRAFAAALTPSQSEGAEFDHACQQEEEEEDERRDEAELYKGETATNPKYLRPGFDFALHHAVEEAGEFLAAAGKTMRWGRESVNPELPAEQQEANQAWLEREALDLHGALDRLLQALASQSDPIEHCGWVNDSDKGGA